MAVITAMTTNLANPTASTETSQNRKGNNLSKLAPLVLVAALAAGACSQAADESTAASGDSDSANMALESAASDQAGGSAGSKQSALPASFENRSIAYTAHVELRSDDPAEAQNRTIALVESKGGMVFHQDAIYDDQPSVNLTLKIPPKELEAFTNGLSKFGDITQSDKSAEDVTEAVVDLDARISNAAKSVERTREYLDQAADLTQLSNLERELTTRETELEILVAQQRQLSSRTDMATLTVNISEPEAGNLDDDTEIAGFSAAFSDGFGALKEVGLVAAAILGFTLPFLLVVAVFVVPFRIARKKRGPTPAAS